jgi:serine/threonine protein kinase
MTAGIQQFSVQEMASGLNVDPGQLRYLGTGSFGETWQVSGPNGFLACKIIYKPGYSVTRLNREVTGLQRLNHPNIVRLIDVTEVELRGEKRPALHFEYIAGGDIEAVLAQGSPPTSSDVLATARALVSALVTMHAAAVVHRDIKPANVALRGGLWDQPVILDLGLARLLDGASYTEYPQLIGTPLYMAPEQLRGEPARKGVDLWAIGVLLYVLLTRRHPFIAPGETIDLSEAIQRLQSGPPPLPPSVPPPLASVVPRLLRPEAYQRGSAASTLRRLNET